MGASIQALYQGIISKNPKLLSRMSLGGTRIASRGACVIRYIIAVVGRYASIIDDALSSILSQSGVDVPTIVRNDQLLYSLYGGLPIYPGVYGLEYRRLSASQSSDEGADDEGSDISVPHSVYEAACGYTESLPVVALSKIMRPIYNTVYGPDRPTLYIPQGIEGSASISLSLWDSASISFLQWFFCNTSSIFRPPSLGYDVMFSVVFDFPKIGQRIIFINCIPESISMSRLGCEPSVVNITISIRGVHLQNTGMYLTYYTNMI